MKTRERFKRYADKFRQVINPAQQAPLKKETLGEIITDEVNKAVNKRLNEIIPLVAVGGGCKIQSNTGSFWDQPRKQITLFVLIEFSEDTKWLDQENRKE